MIGSKWDFAAKHLESSSEQVAVASYNLLAVAPLAEVQKRASLVGQKTLLGWVRNGSVPEQRRALYLLMAIPGLAQGDLAWVKPALFSPARTSSSALLPPLIIGYLQLAGPAGIEAVQKTFFKPQMTAAVTAPAHNAMIVVAQTSRSEALRKAARAFFRDELRHPERGPVAIAPLAVWKDYSVAAEVEKIARARPQQTWSKVAVIRYFRSFSTPEAQLALARLKALDPDLVERTTDPYKATGIFKS